MKILLIEDEKIINDNLAKILTLNRFIVEQAYDGKDGLYKASINLYDLIICDINLPHINGYELIKQLREKIIYTPVIFLTARDDMESLTHGFYIGGDDYMTKPFKTEELLVRINAHIRRNSLSKESLIKFDDIEVNIDKKRAFKNGKELVLTSKEYGILEYMLLNRGKIISQSELIEHVWLEDDANDFSSSIRTHIKNIRKKIGDIITTHKGVGYSIS